MPLNGPRESADYLKVTPLTIIRSRLVWIPIAAAALAFTFLGGSIVDELLFEFCGAVAVVSIVKGTRSYRPQHPGIWYGLAAALGIFIISFGIRLAFPAAMTSVPSGAPRLADYIDMAGLTFVVATIFLQSRVRDDTGDPTSVMDSSIVAGSLSSLVWAFQVYPVLSSGGSALSAKLIAIYMGTLLTWLAFSCVRLALTFRTRNIATRRLTRAIILAIIAGLCAVDTTATSSNATNSFAAVALLILGSAALDPSMTELTAPGVHDKRWIPSGRMNSRRVAITAPSLLVPPLVLFGEVILHRSTVLNATYLVVCWTATTGFLALRLLNLMRLRERSTAADHVVMSAATSLVASSTIHETCVIAAKAMTGLLPTHELVIAAVALIDEDLWKIAGADGEGAESIRGITLPDTLVQRVIDEDHLADRELTMMLVPHLGQKQVVLCAPLVSQHEVRGALLLITGEPASVVTQSALKSLATTVTLSIEAIALSERLHAQRRDHRSRALVEHSPDIILVINGRDEISFTSPAAERQLGSASRNVEGLLSLIHPEDRPVFSDLLRRARGHDKRERADQRAFRIGTGTDVRWFDATVSNLLDDPTVEGLVINARDISERKALEDHLKHQVSHDNLTGIANRVLFMARLDDALSTGRMHRRLTAVLFVDLDDFKTVNDLLGHDAGDHLLEVVAYRLETSIRSGDLAARFGGDEFAILLSDLQDVETATATAARILEAITQPLAFNGREISVSASIGIALGDGSFTADVLLRNADVAMYHSKQTGKNRIKLFDDAMLSGAFERLEMKVELSHALERNELSLHYQPLFRIHDRQIVGFEALLRWTHPALGLVPPGSFVPLAEQSGAIVEIGRWVLREATQQLARWRQLYDRDLFMSVNISPIQLDHESIVEDAAFAIEQAEIDPNHLVLEVTESAGLEDPESRQRLDDLHGLGCRLAADDFGTGFASYAAIQQLPFTSVKIDRGLVAGLLSGDNRAQVQMQSIIDMAHRLGMTITAEGVEEDQQLNHLMQLGADLGQGYLMGRPLPATEAERSFLSLPVS